MYSNQLAIAIKTNGKVLREDGDTVRLPFGSEFSILIKNLNSVKVRCSVQIDGQDIADGEKFIIDANDSMELERFLKNKNFKAGNRFRFIERTQAVENGRGIEVEDGLVRVEYEFEQVATCPLPYMSSFVAPAYPYWIYPYWIYTSTTTTNPPYYTKGPINPPPLTWANNAANCTASTQNFTATSSTCSAISDCTTTVNNVGITVPGSESTQTFTPVSDICGTGNKMVMVLRLIGKVNEKPVKKPITVAHKVKCITCKRVNKSSSKFCAECGTALELL
jgi:hypothetical protein